MSEKRRLVDATTLKGFQDLFPEDLIHRKAAIRAIEAVFERYGFVPLETPALEYLEVLLGAGGEATNKELFRLESPEGEAIALRFDLTVPFARLLAQYPERLKPPVRRYAIGPVWRADKPGPGRFRQFTQFDVDVAGAETVAADAEIIAIMCAVMDSVGAPDYRVLVNNRKLIDALLTGCGIVDAARQKHVLRVIDKLQKVGPANIRLELGPGRIDESGDPIQGVGLDAETIERVLAFVGLQSDTRAGVVEALRGALSGGPQTDEALAEMAELAAALDALGIPEGHAQFDPSLARGLDYYTGPVFETIIPSAPQFGSVMGGGRYNQLVERFLDQPIPCTGMSVGLDRLMAALAHLGVTKPSKTTVQVLVVTLGKGIPKAETLKVASELRAAGIATEAYLGKKAKMGDQLSHADRAGIQVAVILGEDEIARGEVSVKDLLAGKVQREGIEDRDEYRKSGKVSQVTVPRADMVSQVLAFLGAAAGS